MTFVWFFTNFFTQRRGERKDAEKRKIGMMSELVIQQQLWNILIRKEIKCR